MVFYQSGTGGDWRLVEVIRWSRAGREVPTVSPWLVSDASQSLQPLTHLCLSSWQPARPQHHNKSDENQWKSMEIHENQWKPMDVKGNQWNSMKIAENQWDQWARPVPGAIPNVRRKSWGVGESAGHLRGAQTPPKPRGTTQIASTSLQSPPGRDW